MAMTLLFPLALAITFSTKFEGGSLGYGLPMSGGDMVSGQVSSSIHQDRAARQVFPMVLDTAGNESRCAAEGWSYFRCS